MYVIIVKRERERVRERVTNVKDGDKSLTKVGFWWLAKLSVPEISVTLRIPLLTC